MSTRKNTLYNVAYRVFSILLPLLTAPYLARVTGQDGVGTYSFAWNINYAFTLVAMLGLENYGVRVIAKAKDDPGQLNAAFSSIWRMQRAVAGLTLVVYLLYSLLAARRGRDILLALTPALAACLCNLDWCLMGLDRFRPIALRNAAVKLLAAAAVFLFVRGPGDLWIYGLVWGLASLLGAVSCALSLRGSVRRVSVTRGDALRHLKPCALLFVSVLAVSVYRTMDKVMVGAIAGMAQNGLYENAEKIVYCLSGFILAVGSVMMPKASHLTKAGRLDAVKTRLDTTLQLVLCMVCAFAFGLAAVAEDFAVLFYGADFAYSGTLMIPLGFTLIAIGFANVIRTHWILPQERDTLVLKCVVTGAVVNLAANSLLIPPMGAMGAVVGTLLAEGAVPLVQFLFLRRELPYRRYLRHLLSYCALGAVMLLAVRAVAAVLPLGGWAGLAVQVITGAAVYLGGCLALWHLTRNQQLLRLLRRRQKSPES